MIILCIQFNIHHSFFHLAAADGLKKGQRWGFSCLYYYQLKHAVEQIVDLPERRDAAFSMASSTSSTSEEADLKPIWVTVYPKKYAHGFVVLCFVVVMQSFIMNSHEVFIHIHQGCFAGTGAIVRLPQCQWSKTDGYGKISQCITTTKHSKAKTMCIFLGIYCMTTARAHFINME